jgi:putative ABC transport system permease protein
MINMIDLTVNTLTQGLIYALLSYGVYITYKILDFPDLTVDGSFPLGAAITAVLLTNQVNPYLTLVIALLCGALAGLVTGIIHVRLHIRDLLAGIITMTALFSINLQIAGSNLIIDRSIATIFTTGLLNTLMANVPLIYRKLIVAVLIALIFKIILDLYFKTKSGLLLRAVGDNDLVVTTLAKDKGTVKIIGLTIANALVALSGSIVCQEQRAFSSTMGTGQVVFGLATVIMGTTVFKRFGFVKGTTAVLVGSIIYKACIQVALSLGLPANLLKLITSLLFLGILVYGNYQKKHTKVVTSNA